MLTFVLITIITAFIFDFYNGMKDAANSIATVVSTRVLKPWQAVVWAAFFNFIAAFGSVFFIKILPIPFLSKIFELHVAATVGKGIIHIGFIPPTLIPLLIFCALIGGISWTSFCVHNGIPISVSHALIGGLIGATLVATGTTNSLIMAGILKTVIFIVIAPVMGLVLGWLFMIATYWLFRNQTPYRTDKYFRKMQLISAAAYSLGHGTNDAQKTMGIIVLLLFSTPGTFYYGKPFEVPVWVVLSCHFMIAMGTMAGGWHVIKTLGQKVTKLQPVHGFCAETGGAISLFVSSAMGAPVSTTHVITGAIIGVGATQRLSAIRWGVAKRIVFAWILTIPLSAAVSGLVYYFLHFFF
jgi:PiT family inorganic phosphate transporter